MADMQWYQSNTFVTVSLKLCSVDNRSVTANFTDRQCTVYTAGKMYNINWLDICMYVKGMVYIYIYCKFKLHRNNSYDNSVLLKLYAYKRQKKQIIY